MKKYLYLTLVITLLVFLLSGTAFGKETLDIAVVLPSIESQYWGQYVEIGCRNAALDIKEKYDVDVNYSVHGPAAEAETEAFLSILEAVVSKRPDGIALGNLNPDAVAPIVKAATKSGILVNLISIGVPLPGEYFGTLYYCDQPEQGKLAAEAFYKFLKEKNLPLDGIVGVHMSVVVPVLEEKIQKFRDVLSELAPDLTLLETQYNENDISKGMSLVESQLAAYGDKIIGFFGGNNVTGNAISSIIAASGKAGSLVSVSVDSDHLQIEALRKGNMDALVVQTPYEQGYRAVMNIYEYLYENKEDPDGKNMPASVVTKSNMDEPEMKALLDPLLLERK